MMRVDGMMMSDALFLMVMMISDDSYNRHQVSYYIYLKVKPYYVF